MQMSENPCALVTGASGGLGTEIARVLAFEGFDLLLVARNEKKLRALKEELEVAHGIEVQTLPCDLSRKDAALDVYDYVLGRGMCIDVLVNNGTRFRRFLPKACCSPRSPISRLGPSSPSRRFCSSSRSS